MEGKGVAITDVRRIRNGERITEGSDKSVVWCYHVESNDATDTIELAKVGAYALFGSPLPVRGEIVVVGGTSYDVETVEFERVDRTPFLYLATVTLGIRDGGDDQTGSDATEVWEVTVSKTALPYEQSVYKDRDDKRIANSAGVAYDPPLVETFYDEKLSIAFKTRTLRTDQADACRGKVNKAAVVMNVNGYRRTFAKETLLLVSDTESAVVRPDGTPFWEVSLEIIYRADGHTRRLVDQGLERIPSGGSISTGLVPILDKNNQPVTSPRFLDGAGAPLADGEQVVLRDHNTKQVADYMPLLRSIATATV